MGITKIVTYTCSDGKVFDTENAAGQHEEALSRKSEARYEQWIRTSYGARRLLEKHGLNEFGVWRIRGEDPNCDFGGSHYQPELGVVEGNLKDVIKYAVKLHGFYTWGSGGDITKVEIKRL